MRLLQKELIALLAALMLSGAARDVEAQSPPCVRHWGEAHYRGLGYDHVIYLRNTCQAPAECAVGTNVDPSPVTVTVPTGSQREVIIRRGSPARQFEPRVTCRLTT